MLSVQVLMELLPLLKGLSHSIREISIFKTMEYRVIRLQCLQECFFFFLCKKMPLSRCRTEVSVASDVAVRGQLGSKSIKHNGSFEFRCKRQNIPSLKIPVLLALVFGKKQIPSNLKKEFSSSPPLTRPLNPTKFCYFLGNGLVQKRGI